MASWRVTLGGVALVASAMGCQVVLGFEELQPESTGGATNQAGASGMGPTDDPCAELEVPAEDGAPMAKIARADGSCFLMDEHEVTNAQYAVFVEAEQEPPSAECTWNEQLVDAECQSAESVTGGDDHPAVCVDQCDAKAYCQWAGKELCRGSYVEPANESEDDWYSACSNRGTAAVPYDNASTAEVCNIQSADNGTTWAADAGISCVNDEGVRDLIGNVMEWVAACESSQGADDDCLARGGSFLEQRPDCAQLFMPKRGHVSPALGFRCCAYPE